MWTLGPVLMKLGAKLNMQVELQLSHNSSGYEMLNN